MKVHLVDGTYELFRNFFGAPPATGATGQEVGAVRGLVRTLGALLRTSGVSHVGIAFDTVIESFRNQLYAGYKTGAGIEPALLAQFPLAERAAEALGLATWRMIDFEADDALATAAWRAARDERVEQVVLCSPDKDLCQCVRGQRVVAWDRRRDVVLDQGGVVAKFGVPPEAIPDYLALVGDTADGIPGVPKWGAKSSSTVLARYGALEDIPDDAADWDVRVRGASGLAASLAAHRPEAALYKRLATLRSDVPLAETVDDLRWRGADPGALRPLCEELGEPELADRLLG